jgi:Flp pilus assembly protein TadD
VLGDATATLERWRLAWAAHGAKPAIGKEYGLALLRADLVTEAREINRATSEASPEDATLWCNRALSELLCGDLAEARRCVDECRSLDPGDPIARNLSSRIARHEAGAPTPKTLRELEGRPGRP